MTDKANAFLDEIEGLMSSAKKPGFHEIRMLIDLARHAVGLADCVDWNVGIPDCLKAYQATVDQLPEEKN